MIVTTNHEQITFQERAELLSISAHDRSLVAYQTAENNVVAVLTDSNVNVVVILASDIADVQRNSTKPWYKKWGSETDPAVYIEKSCKQLWMPGSMYVQLVNAACKAFNFKSRLFEEIA